MKKRTFLLLEVLISFLLVSTCILPLVSQPLKMFLKEWSALETLEKERLADWAFSEVKEKFLKKEIPWKQIPALHETTGPFPLPNMSLKLKGCSPKTLTAYYTLFGQGRKQGKHGEEFRQIYVNIFLHEKGRDPQHYEYRLPIEK